jgi:hypothetical protein
MREAPGFLFGGDAFADVDAHPDDAGLAVDLDAQAGEEIRLQAPILGEQVRLDRRHAHGEHLGDPGLEALVIPGLEEVLRPHAADLVVGVAGRLLEVRVPLQKAAVSIVEIENAGEALDDRP